MRVFISHSHEEKSLVRELRNNFPPWLRTLIDEDRLLFGSELGDALKDAIYTEVDFFVVLLDRRAINRDWIRKETGWALDMESRLGRPFLLLVLLDDIRDMLPDIGLSKERISIDLADREEDSVRLLAQRVSNHLAGWMTKMLAIAPRTRPDMLAARSHDELSSQLISLLSEVGDTVRGEVRSLLVQPLIYDLAAARVGSIPLTREKYYQRVFTAMIEASAHTQVIAVSTLASNLWTDDADQVRYARENYAAIGRGVKIRRLFVLSSDQASAFEDIIRLQEQAGIDVRMASTDLLAHVPDLEDLVLFDDGQSANAYIAHPSIDGSRRIRSGSLVLSELGLAKRREAFDDAWRLAQKPDDFFGQPELEATPGAGEPPSPGLGLRSRRLKGPVVTCEEAAKARGIPLAQELKTLLLHTQHGTVAAHLPGDTTLDLRKVKTRLETAEAYLLSPEGLLELGLTPGTVCAILEPVWSMPHLVSRRLLEMSHVATNDGTRTGYFMFDPAVLMTAALVTVDDFER